MNRFLARRFISLLLFSSMWGALPFALRGALRNAPGITLPQAGSTITTAPLTVRIDLPASSSIQQFTATLNGKDITALFAPPTDQKLLALVPAAELQSGNNQLSITGITGLSVTSVQFQYNAAARGAIDSSSVRFKPITTRVLQTGTTGASSQDFGISVGDNLTGITYYWAPPYPNGLPGSDGGFQVLTLGRDSTLNPAAFSNQSYDTESALPGPDGIPAMFDAINRQVKNHCQLDATHNGCVVVIQSLSRIGVTGCNTSQGEASPLCQQDKIPMIFWGMAEPFAMGQNDARVAYSYIGNATYDPSSNQLHASPQGLNYERFTCSSQNKSDCLAPGSMPYSLDGTAPANAALSEIGRISGALVRDQGAAPGLYTFTPTARSLSYRVISTPATASNSITITVAGDPTLDSNGNRTWWTTTYGTTVPAKQEWTYPSKPATGDGKGIRLFVLDASNTQDAPAVIFDETFPLTFVAGQPFSLLDLPGFIKSYHTSRRCLIILSLVGNISEADRKASYTNNGWTVNDVWDYVADAVATIGGDYRTFQQLSRTPFTTPDSWPASPEDPDQYTLVGFHGIGDYWQQSGGRLLATNAAELSTFITRQTLENPQSDPATQLLYNNLNGFLRVGHTGYLEPAHSTSYRGMAAPLVSVFQNAANEPSADWPVCGRENCTQGQLNAYQYISKTILGNPGDLRSQYAESLADSFTFVNWIGKLLPMEFVGGNGFTQNDFNQVKQELTSEFSALGTLGDFNSRMHAFFTEDALVNNNTISSVGNQIASDLQIDNTVTPIQPPQWLQTFNDVVEVAGPLIGFVSLNPEISPAYVAGGETAVALLGAVVDTAATTTTSPQGDPLQATEEVEQTAASAFDTLSSNYVSYLSGVNALVQRIGTDANRLNHFIQTSAILANNQVSPTAPGLFTDSALPLTIAFKRQIFTKLIAATYDLAHFQYAAPSFSPASDNNIHNAYGVYNLHTVCYRECDDFADVCEVGRALYAGHNATMFYPGNMIDGVRQNITIGPHTFPNDLWWDFYGIGVKGQIQTDCPRNENFQDADNNFVKYNLFQKLQLRPGSSTGTNQNLGIYQSYFFNPKRTGFNLLELNSNNSYWSCAYNSKYSFDPKASTCYPTNGDGSK